MEQKILIRFLILWIANSLLLIISSAIFANNVALGNANLPKSIASVFNGFILTALIYSTPYMAKRLEIKLKDDKVTAAAYFAVNFIALWVLKRLADFTALGISSILFVLIVAVVGAGVQIGVDKYASTYINKLKK